MGKQIPESIKFLYTKTPNYRTYHVDGMFGGLNAKGNLFIELFVEINPLPESISQEITKEGILGKEINRVQEEGILRQVECGLSLNIETAKSMRRWLDNKINDYEKFRSGEKK